MFLALSFSFFMIADNAAISTPSSENLSLIARFEKGEPISIRSGSSLTIQTLLKDKSGQLQGALKSPEKLSLLFPEVAFARAFVMPAQGKKLLYLKLRGMGDGTSALMEVKKGSESIFASAQEYLVQTNALSFRETLSEVDLIDEANRLGLLKPEEAQVYGQELVRKTDLDNELVLEGPLNPLMQAPNLRFTIHVGAGLYKVAPRSKPYPTVDTPYLIVKIVAGKQIVRGEIGDILGFGDSKLRFMERGVLRSVASLKDFLGR